MSLTSEERAAGLQAEFAPTPAALIDLAAEYHRRTEEYDRTVCTGPMGRDGIMPATTKELFLINRNARDVWHELVKKAVEQGFSRDEFRREVHRAA